MKKEVFASFHSLQSATGNRLCSPVNCAGKQEILFEELAGKLLLQLRIICLPDDIACICPWIYDAYAAGRASQQPLNEKLLEMYSNFNRSNQAQALMVLVHAEPVCLVDVYNAVKDEVSCGYKARDGDYKIRLLVKPQKKDIPGLYNNLLRTILKYCFRYPEVKRLILELDNPDDVVPAKEAGMHFLQKIKKPWNELNLLYVHRSG